LLREGYLIITLFSVLEVTLIAQNRVDYLQNLAPSWHQIKNTYKLGLLKIRPSLTTSKSGLKTLNMYK